MHVDRDIFKNALDAIIITEASSGVIREINPSALKLLHKRKIKTIGTNIQNYFDGNLNKNRGEVVLKKSDTVLQYNNTPSSTKGTHIYFFRDITDIKQEMLRREHFLGIAGHELKNPIAAIKALHQLLLMQKTVKEEPKIKELIQKAEIKTNTLLKLITELLDVTKIKHKRLDLNLEDVSFNKIIKEVVDDFHRINSTHKVEITNDTDIKIKVDKIRIEQVLINLLKNGAKYSPESGMVFINVEKTKRWLVCEVIDFGIGMPTEEISKVFNLYYRLPGREKTIEGLGVGLYIAYQIIKAHGGKMRVKSAPGRGSQFIFYLPLISKIRNRNYSYYEKS